MHANLLSLNRVVLVLLVFVIGKKQSQDVEKKVAHDSHHQPVVISWSMNREDLRKYKSNLLVELGDQIEVKILQSLTINSHI